MTKEEIKEYKRLDEMFFVSCMCVCTLLGKKYNNFKYMNDFYLDNSYIVHCDGYNIDNGTYVHDTFDMNYLFMTKEELLKL